MLDNRTNGTAVAQNAPLYVKTIVLHGQLCQDMYDSHPGYAYFYTDSWESFPVPSCCSLTTAMKASLKLLRMKQKEIGTEDEYDGLFRPSSIILLDQLGNAVQEFRETYIVNGQYRGAWLKELPAESEWAALENKAGMLDNEAAVESGWDNFETARSLRNSAQKIRRVVQIARVSHQALP